MDDMKCRMDDMKCRMDDMKSCACTKTRKLLARTQTHIYTHLHFDRPPRGWGCGSRGFNAGQCTDDSSRLRMEYEFGPAESSTIMLRTFTHCVRDTNFKLCVRAICPYFWTAVVAALPGFPTFWHKYDFIQLNSTFPKKIDFSRLKSIFLTCVG